MDYKHQELEQKLAILHKMQRINREMGELSKMPGYQEVLNSTAYVGIGVLPESDLDLTDIKFGFCEAVNIVSDDVGMLRECL